MFLIWLTAGMATPSRSASAASADQVASSYATP
jgi:hypothetical protein